MGSLHGGRRHRYARLLRPTLSLLLCAIVSATALTAASSQSPDKATALDSIFEYLGQAGGSPKGAALLPQQIIIKYVSGGVPSTVPGQLGEIASQFGSALSHFRSTGTQAQVMRVLARLPDSLLERLVQRLEASPLVEVAEVDAIVQPAFVPNDPRYDDQWAYYESTGGMNLPAAWDSSTGSGAVVGVVDTGYRPHIDLAANIVGGYDFISVSSVARDGNGRDSNATDPGDTCREGWFSRTTSSWHGTHTSGSVAAVTNNGTGVAGTAFGAKVLPLRALGSCGGYTSDIADAIIWGAGGSVPGVPTNSNPANVINLSLGHSDSCPGVYQDAVSSARSNGAVVVAAAGNAGSSGVITPANCPGVIGVAATNRNGSKASYSNFGSGVDLAAPGGDGSGGILSTHNTGRYNPGSDSYASFTGTSMSSAHVSGVAALVMAANPGMTPNQVESHLEDTARTPPGSCSGCGAGIVDAAAALGGSPPTTTTSTTTSTTTTSTTVAPTTTTSTTSAPTTTTIASTTTTVDPGGTPSAPLNLNSFRWAGRIVTYWSAPSEGPVTGYNVYRRTGAGAYTKIADVTNTNYFDSGVTSGVTYTYRVAAENVNGEGPPSNEVTETA